MHRGALRPGVLGAGIVEQSDALAPQGPHRGSWSEPGLVPVDGDAVLVHDHERDVDAPLLIVVGGYGVAAHHAHSLGRSVVPAGLFAPVTSADEVERRFLGAGSTD